MAPAPKVALGFPEIANRIAALELPAADLVVGIAHGGTVPAALVAYRLGVPLALLTVNYRDAANRPQRPAPEPLDGPPRPASGTRVLLVDDVSVSGATLAVAARYLGGCEVTTLVLKGRADLVAFPEVRTCVSWPWGVLKPDGGRRVAESPSTAWSPGTGLSSRTA